MSEVYDEENDKMDFFFLNLIKYCWKKKWYFIISIVIASVLLVGFSVLTIKMPPEKSPLPNKYTSTAKLLVRETSATSGVSSSISALASLGGINLGMGGDSSNGVLITTIAETTSFKDAIIDEFELIKRYEIETHVKSNSRKALAKVLSVKVDEETNVLSVSFTDIDPAFAQRVVVFAVDLLTERFYSVREDDNSINLKNYQDAMDSSFQKIVQYQKDIQNLEQSVSNSSATSIPSIMFDVQMKKMELEAEETIYASFKGQYELLSIQMKDNPTTIKLIQTPEVPDMKSSPSRGLICIVGMIAVFAVCFVFAFIRYYWDVKLKKDYWEKEESK